MIEGRRAQGEAEGEVYGENQENKKRGKVEVMDLAEGEVYGENQENSKKKGKVDEVMNLALNRRVWHSIVANVN